MTYSTLATEEHLTTQRSSRGGRAVDHIILHHCATTNMDTVLNMMVSGSRQVSSNYVVKDGRIAAVVPEEFRSWSVSNADWDGRSITFEIANESAGGDWPVSDASHESVARVVADVCARYGIPVNRDRIFGHRELYTRHDAGYATACPGGLNMDWIVNRANAILNPSPLKREDDMDYKYHWDGKRYVLIHPVHITDGAIVTTDPKLAEAFSVITNSGPPKWTPAQLDAEIALAKVLYDQAKANRPTVTLGDVKLGLVDLSAATIATLAKSIAKESADLTAARLKD